MLLKLILGMPGMSWKTRIHKPVSGRKRIRKLLKSIFNLKHRHWRGFRGKLAFAESKLYYRTTATSPFRVLSHNNEEVAIESL